MCEKQYHGNKNVMNFVMKNKNQLDHYTGVFLESHRDEEFEKISPY